MQPLWLQIIQEGNVTCDKCDNELCFGNGFKIQTTEDGFGFFYYASDSVDGYQPKYHELIREQLKRHDL